MHAKSWPFPLDFIALVVLLVFVPALQPGRETGPHQTAAYIDDLWLYLPCLAFMAILAISVVRNQWRLLIVRVIAALLLIPIIGFMHRPVTVLISCF